MTSRLTALQARRCGGPPRRTAAIVAALLCLVAGWPTARAKHGPGPPPTESPPPPKDGGGGDSGGGGGGAVCEVCGGDSVYTEYLSSDGALRVVKAEGCPNHYSGCMKAGSSCDGTTSEATMQDYSLKLPAYPIISDSPVDITCKTGDVGILRNGVVIFSQSDGTTECGDAVAAESTTFDACGGHATGAGMYHYHANPACLLSQLGGGRSGWHSPQLGWSYDGFPIYGPQGPDGVSMRPCAATGAHATYCLDVCNGFYGALSGVDSFTYRYYLSGPVGDLTCSSTVTNSADGACAGSGSCCVSIVPDTSYNPYTIGCYKGCLPADVKSGACTSSENGYTASYSPEPLLGAMEEFGAQAGVGAVCCCDAAATR